MFQTIIAIAAIIYILKAFGFFKDNSEKNNFKTRLKKAKDAFFEEDK